MTGEKKGDRRPEMTGEKKADPRPEEREPRERTAAPPIEREHETLEGVVEQDEERKGQKPPRGPERT